MTVRREPLGRLVVYAVCVLALLGGRARASEDVMRVHFINVGQGAATLVEFPCGTMLVDTGGERFPKEEWKPAKYDSTPKLMEYLTAFFAKHPERHNQIDLLMITHPHKDHTRGIPAVLEAFRPKNVVYNGQSHGSGIEEQTEAREYAKETEGVHGWYVLERTIDGTGLSNDTVDPLPASSCQPTDPKIRVLWGQVKDDSGWDERDFADENNHSVVIRVDFGAASLLFPGDLEETAVNDQGAKTPKAGIERLLEKYQDSKLLDVDVFDVSHHGSHNGTTPELLAAVSPKIAVISAGAPCKRKGFSAWEFGHPRTVTFNDLEHAVSGTRTPKKVTVFDGQRTPREVTVDKAIYSTSWDGTTVLEAKADGTWSVAETKGATSCSQ